MELTEVFKEQFPNCAEGHQYALDVLSGKIVANIYVKGACRRYLKDIQDDRYVMRWNIAERYLALVQKFEHVIGVWDTPNIVYAPWQKWVWMNIIGLYSKETRNRKYRTAHVEIPRGNAKSTMASQCALYFLALDEEGVGNQISCVATRREQAKIVFNGARSMAIKNQKFCNVYGVEPMRNIIEKTDTFAHIVAKSSEHKGLDGLADVLAVCDELHAMRQNTFDVISSGMAKRRDSLILCITTAGQDIHSVGHSQSAWAKKVALGEIEDEAAETFFAVVYCPDEKDDPFLESTWKKANPGWGISVDTKKFKADAMKAQLNPADAPNFKIKHLNMWISEANAYFSLNDWDACGDPNLTWDMVKNKKCFAAIDLASMVDLTATAYLFKGEDNVIDIWCEAFLPEETIKLAKNPLYDNALPTGELIATKGSAINYDKFEEHFLEKSRQVAKVQEVYYDPWAARQMAQRLSAKRVNMIEMGMNAKNLSEPMKRLDALMKERKIRHNAGKLLRWNIGNVVAKEDHNQNVFPRKSHEKLKIDMALAIIMAMAGWIQELEKESAYQQRGFVFL